MVYRRTLGLAGRLVVAGLATVWPVACSQPNSGGIEAAVDGGGDSSEKDSGLAASKDAASPDCSENEASSPKPSCGSDAAAPPGEGSNPWDEPGVWKPIPELEPCTFYVADLSQYEFPKRVWEGCGPGCEVASAFFPGDFPFEQRAGRPPLAGAWVHGDIYLRLNVSTKDGGTIHQVVRLSDEETIAAIKIPAQTKYAVTGWADEVPLLIPITARFEDQSLWYQAAKVGRERAMPLAWHGGWIPDMEGGLTGAFNWHHGWGMSFRDGSVRVVTDPTQPTMTTIDTALLPTYHISARGDLIAWAHWNDRDRRQVLRAYSKEAGVQELVSEEGTRIQTVTLSDYYIIWVGVHGDEEIWHGRYEAAEMYWSPIAKKPEDIRVTKGPTLPANTGLLYPKSGGDYVAIDGCMATGPDGEGDCETLVVRLSTKQLWRIPNRPGGHASAGILAVSPDEIVLAEVDWPLPDPAYRTLIQRIVRLKTAELDVIEASWRQ